jgi:hypothetical protein
MTLNQELVRANANVITALKTLADKELQKCLTAVSPLNTMVMDRATLKVYCDGLGVRHNNPYKGAGLAAGFAVAVMTSIARFKFFYVNVFSALSFGVVHFAVKHYVASNPLDEGEKAVYEAWSKLLKTEGEIKLHYQYQEEESLAFSTGSEEAAEEAMARGPQAPAAEPAQQKQ